MRVRRWSPLLLLALVLLAGCSREMSESEKGTGSMGQAPDFTLPDLSGGQFTLSSLRGKVVVLNFWATWCPPCRSEIPDFVRFHEQYQEKGVEIVGIALDRGGEAAVRPFVEKQGMHYIVVLGGQEVAEKYGGIKAIPTTFIVDHRGDIRKKHIGVLSKRDLEKEVGKLLEATE